MPKLTLLLLDLRQEYKVSFKKLFFISPRPPQFSAPGIMLKETFKPKLKKISLSAGSIVASLAISATPASAQEVESPPNNDSTIPNIEEFQEKVEELLTEGVASLINHNVREALDNLFEAKRQEIEGFGMVSPSEQLLLAQQDVSTPPLPDRDNCEEMRGTEYRSQKERDFFLKNCIIEPEPPEMQANRADCNAIQGTEYYSPAERSWYLANCLRQSMPQGQQETPSSSTTPPIAPTGAGRSAGAFSISGYYCQRVVGYPGYDGGGFCTEGASGLGTVSGQTAACGPSWPFGTKFEIEGYGQVTCTDRGGAVHDGHLDVYFDTDQQLRNAGLPSSANVRVVE